MNSAIPTDSVLRRHYDATHGKRSANQTQSQCKSNQGGMLAWLKRIFS